MPKLGKAEQVTRGMELLAFEYTQEEWQYWIALGVVQELWHHAAQRRKIVVTSTGMMVGDEPFVWRALREVSFGGSSMTLEFRWRILFIPIPVRLREDVAGLCAMLNEKIAGRRRWWHTFPHTRGASHK